MFFCDLWAWMGSNHRPSGYEPRALPLSYRPEYRVKLIKGQKGSNHRPLQGAARPSGYEPPLSTLMGCCH